MMTDTQVQEGNKLIAEFMGVKYYQSENITADLVQYHSSWDWLMPVVEKIEGLGFTIRIDSRKDDTHWVWIWEDEEENPIVAEYSKSKLQSVYQAVLSFINQTKSK